MPPNPGKQHKRQDLGNLKSSSPGVDAGAVTEQRPDDGDDAFLGREVEWRPALAILLIMSVFLKQLQYEPISILKGYVGLASLSV